MIHARRSVPGLADIPFHVGVPGKHFPVLIEGQIHLVTKSTCQNFPFFSFRVSTLNRTDAIILTLVMRVGQQVIILRIEVGGIRCDPFRETDVVSDNQIDLFCQVRARSGYCHARSDYGIPLFSGVSFDRIDHHRWYL